MYGVVLLDWTNAELHLLFCESQKVLKNSKKLG